MDWMRYVTDPLGITDTQAPWRARDAAVEGMQNANQQLDQDMQPQLSQLWDAAMNGRSVSDNLDAYDSTMSGVMQGTQQAGQNALAEMNAGSADNVQNYLNPKMDEMLRGTSQAVQGSAGSALQSSATNRNVADTVSKQAGQMWDTAFQQALGDSSHNLQANQQYGQSLNTQANLANAQLEADNNPVMSWINLNNDRAMQRYAGNVGTTQANVAAQGQSRAFL